MLRVAVLVHLREPLLDVGDADRLRAVRHVVLVDVRRVYSTDPREARCGRIRVVRAGMLWS